MVQRWEPTKHYRAIASWYHAQDKEAPLLNIIPEIGFVVEGKAAGWLSRTDSNTGLIEHIVFNPHTSPSTRQGALQAVVGTLMDTSVLLGYTRIVAATDLPELQSIYKKYFLKPTEQVVYVIDETDVSEPEDYIDD